MLVEFSQAVRISMHVHEGNSYCRYALNSTKRQWIRQAHRSSKSYMYPKERERKKNTTNKSFVSGHVQTSTDIHTHTHIPYFYHHFPPVPFLTHLIWWEREIKNMWRISNRFISQNSPTSTTATTTFEGTMLFSPPSPPLSQLPSPFQH